MVGKQERGWTRPTSAKASGCQSWKHLWALRVQGTWPPGLWSVLYLASTDTSLEYFHIERCPPLCPRSHQGHIFCVSIPESSMQRWGSFYVERSRGSPAVTQLVRCIIINRIRDSRLYPQSPFLFSGSFLILGYLDLLSSRSLKGLDRWKLV